MYYQFSCLVSCWRLSFLCMWVAFGSNFINYNYLMICWLSLFPSQFIPTVPPSWRATRAALVANGVCRECRVLDMTGQVLAVPPQWRGVRHPKPPQSAGRHPQPPHRRLLADGIGGWRIQRGCRLESGRSRPPQSRRLERESREAAAWRGTQRGRRLESGGQRHHFSHCSNRM